MIMTEKELAYNICRVMAQSIVDENGGITMGGISFGEAYAQRRHKAGDSDVMDISECQMALRHWVNAVGYGKDGKFQVIMSNYIQNC